MNAVNTASEQPYHHGNLHDALITQALAHIADGTPLTLRGLARDTGVSASAVYRHFTNLEDLSIAVRDHLLVRQAKALAESLNSVDPDISARERIRLLGRGYLDFALSEPRLFAAFGTLSRGDSTQSTHEHDTYMALVDAVREAQAGGRPGGSAGTAFGGGGVTGRGESAQLSEADATSATAVALWSVVHGLAVLLTTGGLRDVSEQRKSDLIEGVLDRAAGMIDPPAAP